MKLIHWIKSALLDMQIEQAERSAIHENKMFRVARMNEIMFQAKANLLRKQRMLTHARPDKK
jgi:hypothetical protein